MAEAGEMELALIGSALLTDPERGSAAAEMVRPDDLSTPERAAIWRGICSAWERGEYPDPLAIGVAVARETQSDSTRVTCGLMSLMTRDDSLAALTESRARLVEDATRRRSLASFGHELVESAVSGDDLEALAAYVSSYADALDGERARSETGEMDDVAEVVEAASESGEARGLSTGIDVYDSWTGGLHRGEVHVIGGASGVGKTWLVGQIATTAALNGASVALVSLEMSREAMYIRLMASRIGLRAYRLMGRGRTWSAEEYAQYRHERDRLLASPLRLYTEQRSLADITGLVRQTEPDVVLVDYMQLLDPPAGASSAYEAATENARGLQRLAQRARCTVVIATQMSREALRAGPSSAVLGAEQSGRIDHVADAWIEVRRGEQAGEVEIVARKVRSGPTGGRAMHRLDAETGRLVPVDGRTPW